MPRSVLTAALCLGWVGPLQVDKKGNKCETCDVATCLLKNKIQRGASGWCHVGVLIKGRTYEYQKTLPASPAPAPYEYNADTTREKKCYYHGETPDSVWIAGNSMAPHDTPCWKCEAPNDVLTASSADVACTHSNMCLENTLVSKE